MKQLKCAMFVLSNISNATSDGVGCKVETAKVIPGYSSDHTISSGVCNGLRAITRVTALDEIPP